MPVQILGFDYSLMSTLRYYRLLRYRYWSLYSRSIQTTRGNKTWLHRDANLLCNNAMCSLET
jgi:hypothetical protein